MAKTDKKDEVQPIIVKKVKKVAGGHHGGAWKVAYADFVTAMMAFFLLLWLLNVSTSDDLKTIANYFDPTQPKVSQNTSGAGGVMGGLSISREGSMVTTVQPMTQPTPVGLNSPGKTKDESEEDAQVEKLEENFRKQEDQNFESAKNQIEKQLQENPDLKELAKNVLVDITPEGLRIQLIDQQGKPLFPSGSAEMYDYTRKIIALVTQTAIPLPNQISMRGHTDSHAYPPGAIYTNWELSADRANAARREFVNNKLPLARVANVLGRADREPLITNDPNDARNRRITIMLLRETLNEAAQRGALGDIKKLPAVVRNPVPANSFQKTKGNVYFP